MVCACATGLGDVGTSFITAHSRIHCSYILILYTLRAQSFTIFLYVLAVRSHVYKVS